MLTDTHVPTAHVVVTVVAHPEKLDILRKEGGMQPNDDNTIFYEVPVLQAGGALVWYHNWFVEQGGTIPLVGASNGSYTPDKREGEYAYDSSLSLTSLAKEAEQGGKQTHFPYGKLLASLL